MEEIKCNFCKHGDETRTECGKLHCQVLQDKIVAAHKKCMQYSAQLVQYKFKSFGGFKIAKVEEEIKRGKYMKCNICKANKKSKCVNGATCGCAIKSCKKTFHFICALRDPQTITTRLAAKTSDPPVILYRVFCSRKHETEFIENLKEKFSHVSSADDDSDPTSDEDDNNNGVSENANESSSPFKNNDNAIGNSQNSGTCHETLNLANGIKADNDSFSGSEGGSSTVNDNYTSTGAISLQDDTGAKEISAVKYVNGHRDAPIGAQIIHDSGNSIEVFSIKRKRPSEEVLHLSSVKRGRQKTDVALVIHELSRSNNVCDELRKEFVNVADFLFWTDIHKDVQRDNIPFMMIDIVRCLMDKRYVQFVEMVLDGDKIQQNKKYQDYFLNLKLEGNAMKNIRNAIFHKIKMCEKECKEKNHLVPFELVKVESAYALIVHINETLDPSNMVLNFLREKDSWLCCQKSGLAFYKLGTPPEEMQEAHALKSYIQRKLGVFSFRSTPQEPLLLNSSQSLCMLELEKELRAAACNDIPQPNVVVCVKNVEGRLLDFSKFCSTVFGSIGSEYDLKNLVLLIDLSKDNARFDYMNLLQYSTFGTLNEDLSIYTAENISGCVSVVLVHYFKGR